MTAKSGKLYLSIFHQPDNNTIALPGLKGDISSIQVLDSNNAKLNCQITVAGDVTYIGLPAKFKLNGRARVLKLNFKSGYSVLPDHVMDMGLNKHLVLDRHNAEKHYSFSGVDYYSFYRSTVENSWLVRADADMRMVPWLSYTQQERDKAITPVMNDRLQTVKLICTDSILISAPTRKIDWGIIYLAGPYPVGANWTSEKVTAKDRKPQLEPTKWKNDEVYELTNAGDAVWTIYQEITAAEEGPYIIRLTSGDGIQVYLNEEEQTVHNNPARGLTQQEYLVLPLKAGVNRLFVKVYKRFAPKTVVRSIKMCRSTCIASAWRHSN
ncbi:hypothetical protein MKQ70_07505 [Chitinophaga sedimenti]|uniref:hypothetical protein n=1 Tax=Chitinophaga sedimenti TaxID=2033606 RepID=UPI00200681DB|nr:hypothetical protein [Chitinophaga sedimenti]MCK7554857.1 hypothetical protein [Chitinophaga sedimenti]